MTKSNGPIKTRRTIRRLGERIARLATTRVERDAALLCERRTTMILANPYLQRRLLEVTAELEARS